MDGFEVGKEEGTLEGVSVGENDGESDGPEDGVLLGLFDGNVDGMLLAKIVGFEDGILVGPGEGCKLGSTDAKCDGVLDGTDVKVGNIECASDGTELGKVSRKSEIKLVIYFGGCADSGLSTPSKILSSLISSAAVEQNDVKSNNKGKNMMCNGYPPNFNLF